LQHRVNRRRFGWHAGGWARPVPAISPPLRRVGGVRLCIAQARLRGTRGSSRRFRAARRKSAVL
jgi:hypothetical protein